MKTRPLTAGGSDLNMKTRPLTQAVLTCIIMKLKLNILAFLIFLVFSISVSGQEKIPNFRELIEKKFTPPVSKSPLGEIKKAVNFNFQMVCPTDTDFAAQRVFEEYGAIFAAQNEVVFPNKCIFETEEAVEFFQNLANPQTENIGGVSTTLQAPAMNALLEARKEAAKKGLAITPRGSLGSKRSYRQTLSLWNSRFFPALNYWTRRGSISRREAAEVKAMTVGKQVERVLQWEEKGLYFSKDFRKSILYSVAVPGASQHIFLLALDVQQYGNPKVREILAKHGWFQTVKSDAPHFTYLGVEEEKLRSLGLRDEWSDGQKFWVPNLDE